MLKEIIHTLDPQFYSNLKHELLSLAESLNWNNGLNQIMLHCQNPNVTDYVSGSTPAMYNKQNPENTYKYLQPSLKNTIIEEFFSRFPGAHRARLINVIGKLCYGMHRDYISRAHLALKTNRNALFIFPELSKFEHIPEDKSVYLVDTTQLHSFVNCSLENRIHLMFNYIKT